MSCGVGFECALCNEHFRSLRGFDGHQIRVPDQEDGYRILCSTESIEKLGFRRDARGFWTQGSGVGRGGSRRRTEAGGDA